MKPDGPVVTKKEYLVRPIELSTCRSLVEEFHYSKGGSNTAVYCDGLFHKENPFRCLGAAWWLPPTKASAINTYPEGDWRKVVALSRLVVRPEVPQNGESFLMGQSIKRIKKDGRFECLLTYADTYRNHTGAIYKATNWEYVGLTKPHDVWVDKDGVMVSRKSGPKTRTAQQMLDLGYRLVGKFPKHKFRILLPKVKTHGLFEGICA